MKLVALAACGLLLTACASTGLSPAQGAEAAETGAEAAYVALATGLKSDMAVNPQHTAADIAIWNQGWSDLQVIRQLYAEGQSITQAVAALKALTVPGK